MGPKKIIGIAASTRRPSKTRALVEMAVADTVKQCQEKYSAEVFDMIDIGRGLGSAFERKELTGDSARIVALIESSDALIVGSPVYKGSYTGLFKHLIDLLEPERMLGKPVLILATGGGYRHALMVEHQLRPLFGFFSALTAPTAVYAADADFTNGILTSQPVLTRVAAGVAEFVSLLPRNHNVLHDRLAAGLASFA